MNLNRRLVLTGLVVTAPMIVRPTSIMPIFSTDDWDPLLLAFEYEGAWKGSWGESVINYDFKDGDCKKLSLSDTVNKFHSMKDYSFMFDNYAFVRRSEVRSTVFSRWKTAKMAESFRSNLSV